MAYRIASQDRPARPARNDDRTALAEATRRHQALVTRLAVRAAANGYQLATATEAVPFDLGWWAERDGDPVLVVAEAKSTTPGNEIKQVRLGVVQVADYAVRLSRAGLTVEPVLYLEHPPSPAAVRIARAGAVRLAWATQERRAFELGPPFEGTPPGLRPAAEPGGLGGELPDPVPPRPRPSEAVRFPLKSEGAVSQSRTRALFEPLVGCMDELLSCELPALFPEVRTDLGTDADGLTIDSGGALVAEVGPAASTADVARMLLGTWLDHGLFAYETGRLPAVTDDGMERATDLEGTALRELLTRAGRAMDTSAPRRSLDGDLERLRPYRRRTAAELREMASVPSVTAKNRAAFLAMADARDRGLTPGRRPTPSSRRCGRSWPGPTRCSTR